MDGGSRGQRGRLGFRGPSRSHGGDRGIRRLWLVSQQTTRAQHVVITEPPTTIMPATAGIIADLPSRSFAHRSRPYAPGDERLAERSAVVASVGDKGFGRRESVEHDACALVIAHLTLQRGTMIGTSRLKSTVGRFEQPRIFELPVILSRRLETGGDDGGDAWVL